MKTPEENKCGMECIRINVERSCVKPEKGQCPRCKQLVDDSLARIQQLEARLAQVERERDAAVKDLEDGGECFYCKRKEQYKKCGYENCSYCGVEECPCWECNRQKNHFEWRGVCDENTKGEHK